MRHTDREAAMARSLLRSPVRMRRVARAVAAADPTAPPRCHVLAGAARLRSAARIGVLAGSFNPLTWAHVALAEQARAAAGLDVLLWTLARVTVAKEQVQRATLADRLAQVVAFARCHPGHAVALCNRGLYLEQALAVRERVGPAPQLWMLLGFDKALQLFDPRFYADREAALTALFAQARVLVAPRGGQRAEDLAALLARPANRPYAAAVGWLDLPPEHALDSSTQVRTLAARADAPAARLAALVPPAALALLDETAPYATSSATDDTYAQRAAWLAALPRLPHTLVARLPPLGELAQRTAAATPSGAALRALLYAAATQSGTSSLMMPSSIQTG